jgi:hypothetical protein
MPELLVQTNTFILLPDGPEQNYVLLEKEQKVLKLITAQNQIVLVEIFILADIRIGELTDISMKFGLQMWQGLMTGLLQLMKLSKTHLLFIQWERKQ